MRDTMHRPTSTAKPPSARHRSARRFLLLMAASLAVAVLAGSGLDAEREELDLHRNRIEERWEDLDQELRVRARLAGELAALPGETWPGVPARDFMTARNSLAGSIQVFGRARGREAAVEAGLSVERALDRFLKVLGAGATTEGDPERSAPAGLRRMPGPRAALDEIQAAEHRVAIRRTAYNEAIQQFNIRLALFPANLAAWIFGFERYPYYLPTDIRDTIEMQRPPRDVETAEKGGGG